MRIMNTGMAVVVASLVTGAQGEVVSGPMPVDRIEFGFLGFEDPQVIDLGFGFEMHATQSDAGGVNIGQIGFPSGGDFLFGGDPNLAQLLYGEGDSVSGEDEVAGSAIFWACSNDVYPDCSTQGELGEFMFIGFRVRGDFLPDEDRYEYNYGFIQLLKTGTFEYDTVGFAYETTADTSLTVFNVPAPSTAALLGVIGMAATRRRR